LKNIRKLLNSLGHQQTASFLAETNLPLVIDFKDNTRIEYTYDALGNKRTQSITQTGGKIQLGQ
jgi:hypothetical protein